MASRKNAAEAFVRESGFPAELAGLPSDERPPDYEYLEARVALGGLAEFQKEVKRRAHQVLDQPDGRAIVTLPTGAGKTRTAVETLKDWLTERHRRDGTRPGQVVLWLAHTEELCEQAYLSFKQVWEWSHDVCPLYLVRFWGQYTRNLAEHRDTLARAAASASVFISTPQRILNLVAEHRDAAAETVEALRHGIGALIIDEAHRAAAPSYLRVLDAFSTSRPSLLGLTATPYRHEYFGTAAGTEALSQVFRRHLIEPGKTLGSKPRERLQELGVLATPVLESLPTKIRLTLPDGTSEAEPDDVGTERLDHALKLEADRAKRRLLVLERIVEICKQDGAHSVLYFGPSVRDAEHMAFLLRQHRLSSAVVSGATREATRRQVVAQFKKGLIQVLCNCEVLTTGFDAPRVTHIVVARPTVSQVLFEQMVGRGLRGPKFGGTSHCRIVNCEDDYRHVKPELGYVGWRRVWQPQEVHRL